MPEASEDPAATAVRYTKPKIATIDLPPSVCMRLRTDGYNAVNGTFGSPCRITGNKLELVPITYRLPNYPEQEIVFVDMTPPESVSPSEGGIPKATSEPLNNMFAKPIAGVIDPRPRAMAMMLENSDRIVSSGGVFVLFVRERVNQAITAGTRTGNHFITSDSFEANNWSILSLLGKENVDVRRDHGTEITVNTEIVGFSSFLRRHLSGATFYATLHPEYRLERFFVPLATNKYGDAVAAVLSPVGSGNGVVLMLPQLKDKEEAVIDLVKTVLPDLLPRLFPDHERGRWVVRTEYEHPSILEQKKRQQALRRKADDEIAHLEREIDAERARLSFIHGILTKTGPALVADLKLALEHIGFTKVVNVDEIEEEGKKQEDLQIMDQAPSLLVEVKGLAWMPREDDTLQVTKYVLRRIKEWKRMDIRGISIVNHQRHLPAMERDHSNAFTDAQVADAVQGETGLMTTWDLVRLIRGMDRWKWPAQTVKDVFYGDGRLGAHPSHYTHAGEVAHYYGDKSVVSINVACDSLRVGDRVGYIFAEGFFEEEVTSLQVDRIVVNEAKRSQRVGMKTTLTRSDVPVGTRIFRVGRNAAATGSRSS